MKTHLLRLIFLIIYFVFFNFNFVFSQKTNFSDWKEIEKHQRFVINQIEKKEYYLNEYKINSNRFALHQPTYFQYFERYFYTFDRRENPPKTLLKAIISRKERNKTNFYKEYILDNDGNLIYYFEQEQPETSSQPLLKLKIYFFENKVIKSFKNDKELNTLDDKKLKEILNNYENLKIKFKN